VIPANLTPLANHLWQSTLFAAVAGLLGLALRKQRAQIRYAIWLAASVKFLIPFALLVSIGGQFQWRTEASITQSPFPIAMEQISQPFAPSAPLAAVMPAASLMSAVMLGIWICGFTAVVFAWLRRWRHIRAAVRAASPMQFDKPLKILSSPVPLEPGVFGIFKPVLLLPEGIVERLSPAQFQAILAHELCHARRRDNFAAALHMTVEALFWFHPLVWWIGSRLMEERERACDEEVLRHAAEPEVYAEGILNVCKFYLASPLRCVSGVTGSNLKKRIEEIMTRRALYNLSLGKKLLLACAATAAIAMPIAIGVLNAPQAHAQSEAPKLTFEVASIKPNSGNDRGVGIRLQPGAGLRTTGTTLKFLLTFAYDVRDFQISGGPGWINSDRFDIVAKSERGSSESAPDDMSKMTDEQAKTVHEQIKQKLQALLADRFQLAVHHETKEQSVYALVIGKNGSKLQESQSIQNARHMMMNRGELDGEDVPLEFLASTLSSQLGRPIIDRTGLTGHYTFKLQWTPDPGQSAGKFAGPPLPGAETPPPSDPNGPSIFTAIQEQLGLRLESQKGPVDLIVIDRVEKPSEN
jgi:bla regulator protein BlaR1